ncbi:hypothetical protein BAE44_0023090 [Dichanthelium oligosanthes]|uniref:FBD domain-containing protein n=1 Tax=Dichanthelium oligosanthes TaxID=888268 RepID=A0A1E5USP2_9POAL|nr:hypothetical protein BAE44_0023090 [Dichanthelium oligosanthes]
MRRAVWDVCVVERDSSPVKNQTESAVYLKEIRSQILSYLNAEESVRASIQSTTWKDVWNKMPQILLCNSSFGSSESSPEIARSKFVTLGHCRSHNGPLDTFSIEGEGSDYHDVFDRWMYMLSMKKPRDITTRLWSFIAYKIPSSLFRINGLEHLYLENSIISLPRMFEGFNRLKVLNLEGFFSTDNDISNLISNCPLLGTLVLNNIWDIYCLNIRAQALQNLVVKGNFEDLHLHTPNLVHARLVSSNHTEDDESDPLQHDLEGYSRQAFGSLTCIKTLIVSNSFLMSQHLAEDFIPKIIFDEDYSDIQAPTLDRLVTITFHDFMGLECEIALLGSLLSWASALEEVTIDVDSSMTDQCICKAMKKLLAFARASAKAKVLFT